MSKSPSKYFSKKGDPLNRISTRNYDLSDYSLEKVSNNNIRIEYIYNWYLLLLR